MCLWNYSRRIKTIQCYRQTLWCRVCKRCWDVENSDNFNQLQYNAYYKIKALQAL